VNKVHLYQAGSSIQGAELVLKEAKASTVVK